MRIIIFYDEQDPRNRGWAYSVQTADACETGALPHRRRAVSLKTLARSLRREYRGGQAFCLAVRLTTAKLRPVPPQAGGPYYEAQS